MDIIQFFLVFIMVLGTFGVIFGGYSLLEKKVFNKYFRGALKDIWHAGCIWRIVKTKLYFWAAFALTGAIYVPVALAFLQEAPPIAFMICCATSVAIARFLTTLFIGWVEERKLKNSHSE